MEANTEPRDDGGKNPAEPSKPGPKPILTRVEVIEAALDLIDSEGLTGLNLRKLAARLSISPMTPYTYFEGKADLLDAMLAHALAPIAEHTTSGDRWDQELEAAMRAMHDSLERHPGVLELIAAEPDDSRIDVFRRDLTAMLVSAGLTRKQSTDALRTLTSYIVGYTFLTRVRGRQSRRGRSRNSFEHGLQQVLESIRREAAGRQA
jgi:AcrR family transcriptional regulator